MRSLFIPASKALWAWSSQCRVQNQQQLADRNQESVSETTSPSQKEVAQSQPTVEEITANRAMAYQEFVTFYAIYPS